MAAELHRIVIVVCSRPVVRSNVHEYDAARAGAGNLLTRIGHRHVDFPNGSVLELRIRTYMSLTPFPATNFVVGDADGLDLAMPKRPAVAKRDIRRSSRARLVD